MSGECNCTCQIAGSHDPDCAVYGPPLEPGEDQRDGEPYCNHDAPAVVDGVCECGEPVPS